MGTLALSLPVWFIAAIGAWIAYQQMQIASVKLQHDLYDRRYRVFDAARKLLAETTVHANSSDETMRAFLLGTGDAVFLFDAGVTEYLEEMRDHAAKLSSISVALELLPVGDQRAAAANARAEHLLWLVAQLDGLPGRFRAALQLDARKRRTSWYPTGGQGLGAAMTSMKDWQKRLVQAVGLGAGFAIVLLAALAAFEFYHSSQAAKWNKNAIVATFSELTVNTGDPLFSVNLSYSVKNNTSNDYTIPDEKEQLFLLLPKNGGLYQFTSGPDPYASEISIDRGGYIPAGRSVVVTVHLKYNYNDTYPLSERDNPAKMAPYVGVRLGRIDGLSLYDKATRYEIDFPNGWQSAVKPKSPPHP